MIESIGELDWVFFQKPRKLVLSQRSQRILVQIVTLYNGDMGGYFTFEINYPWQSNGQQSLNNDHVLELTVIITPVLFFQMPNVKVNENMHELSHCNDED